MCIYYKKDLKNVKNREHIFPAFLGGKKTLPLGYVSDEANQLFSSLEKKASLNSVISLDREFFGPGKRGSNKLGSPVIRIGNINDRVGLYFIFKGIAHICPHIFIKKDLSNIIYSQDNNDSCDEKSMKFKDFIDKITKFDGHFVNLQSNLLNKDELLIGCIKNKFFIGHSPNSTLVVEDIFSIIQRLKNHYKIESHNISNESPTIERPIIVDEEDSRLFAKIGFNALAYLKGYDYVMQDCFDYIRNYIIGKGKYPYGTMPTKKNPLYFIDGKFHYCIFTQQKHHLYATICLYNSWCRIFDFGKVNDKGKTFIPFGMVCDWQNGKEMDFMEFLSDKLKNISNNNF